jgi:hypothetical protein
MCFCTQIRYMTFSISAWLSHQYTYIGYMGRRVITKPIWKRSYCNTFYYMITFNSCNDMNRVVWRYQPDQPDWYDVINLTNQTDITWSAEPTRLIWRYQPNQPDWYYIISLTNHIDITLSAEPTRLIWRYQPNQPDWCDVINLTNQTDMMLSSWWNRNTISALICINDPFTFSFSVHAIVSYSCKICN